MRQTFNAGAALIQNFSAWSLARVFGAISPKISTSTVSTMVEATGP